MSRSRRWFASGSTKWPPRMRTSTSRPSSAAMRFRYRPSATRAADAWWLDWRPSDALRCSAQPSPDGDAAESGRWIFEQRCAVCHTTGERAAQGPGLGGIVGRRAASTHFGYSRALREANPDVISPPAGAHPVLPPGFRADVFARDLLGPRLLRVSPSGDLFVA